MRFNNPLRPKNMNKKGQVVIYDFIFGFMTFIIIVTLITLMWFKSNARIIQENEQEIKLKIARDLSMILTQTPGNPTDWEFREEIWRNKNFTLGFGSDNGIISPRKLNTFIGMNHSSRRGYGQVKELMRLRGYDYYMKIRNRQWDIINVTGKSPKENLSSTVTRIVEINGEIMRLELTIY